MCLSVAGFSKRLLQHHERSVSPGLNVMNNLLLLTHCCKTRHSHGQVCTEIWIHSPDQVCTHTWWSAYIHYTDDSSMWFRYQYNFFTTTSDLQLWLDPCRPKARIRQDRPPTLLVQPSPASPSSHQLSTNPFRIVS